MDLRAGFLASPLLRELEQLARSEEPYPESSAKRHHLVPEFLLRRFAADRGGRQRLIQLDLETGKPQWVDPATAASRSRFYRATDDDGTVHQRVEEFLSRVESHAAEALQRLFDAPDKLAPGDRATLSYFFALLEGRTIGGLERIQSLADTTMKTLFAGRVGDAATFAEDYRRAIGPADDATIERQRAETLKALEEGRVHLSNPKEVALDLLLDHVGDSSQLIYQLHWWILEAEEPLFVTSDRGLAMHDPTPPFPWSGHALLSSPNAQTTIPLDPTRCLLLRMGPEGPTDELSRIEVEAERADEINLRTYGFASDYIFAGTQKAATDLRRMAKRRPGDVVRPRQHHQVMLIETEPGDDRLAREHRERGWPERLPLRGVPHDYVVIDPDDRPVERSVEGSQLAKARAARRLGSDQLTESTVPIDPLDLFG